MFTKLHNKGENMSIEKVIIDAVKFQNLFNLCVEAKHDKPFGIVSAFLEDIKKSVQFSQEIVKDKEDGTE